MYGKTMRKNLSFLLVTIAVFGLGTATLRAGTGQPCGIWIYPSTAESFAIGIMNMTSQTVDLKIPIGTKPIDSDNTGAPLPYCDDEPDQSSSYCFKESVPAFRTSIWACEASTALNPYHWNGSLTFQPGNDPQHAFTLNFFMEKAAGILVGKGTWVYLTPANPQAWATTPNTFAYNRWVTPINDGKAHNIMTLVSNKLMVALYSADNLNVSVVVLEYDPADRGTYMGWKLDWVDNGEESFPLVNYF